jgi:hypothetical protein
MSSVQEPHLHLEVDHILFLDLVGYSKPLSAALIGFVILRELLRRH